QKTSLLKTKYLLQVGRQFRECADFSAAAPHAIPALQMAKDARDFPKLASALMPASGCARSVSPRRADVRGRTLCAPRPGYCRTNRGLLLVKRHARGAANGARLLWLAEALSAFIAMTWFR